MLRLLGIVLSIGLADSLDPTTIGPGLYLALGQRPARQVAQFALGVLVVMIAGGLLVVLLPGQVLLHLIPHPRKLVEYWLEVGVGVTLVLAAALIWRRRDALAERRIFAAKRKAGRSSLLLGIGVMTVNLPIAVPYFAAIAAIVASGLGIVIQALYVVLYSLCFIAPLLVMVVVLAVAPRRSARLLDAIRRGLDRHWASVLAIVLVLAGLFVVLVGVSGVVSRNHDQIGHLARHVHHLLSTLGTAH